MKGAVRFTVTSTGNNNASGAVAFEIAAALTVFDSGNAAFNNLGGPNPANPALGFAGGFDYGLPLFFRSPENQNTPGGAGPFRAY